MKKQSLGFLFAFFSVSLTAGCGSNDVKSSGGASADGLKPPPVNSNSTQANNPGDGGTDKSGMAPAHQQPQGGTAGQPVPVVIPDKTQPLTVSVVNSCQLSPVKTDQELRTLGFISEKGVVYNSHQGENAVTNVYSVSQGAPRPLIVFNHGMGGAPVGFDASFRRLVSEGYAVISPGHLNEDKAIFPQHVADVRCAIRWAKANAKKYNFDPERISVAGFSMGGWISGVVGTTLGAQGVDGPCTTNDTSPLSIRSVVTTAAMFDFLAKDPAAPNWVLDVTFGAARDEAKMKLASAIHNISPQTPPFVVIHGGADPGIPRSQPEAFAKALTAAKIPNALLMQEGEGHAPKGGGQLLYVGGDPRLECTVLKFFKDTL